MKSRTEWECPLPNIVETFENKKQIVDIGLVGNPRSKAHMVSRGYINLSYIAYLSRVAEGRNFGK